MKVVRKDDASKHDGTTFSGNVVLKRLLSPQQDGGLSIVTVHFDDSARTHWHVHPGEQVLYVLEGEGVITTEKEEIHLHPGDVAYTPPGEKHWHGAIPGHKFAHISITTVGSPEWFESVDEIE